MSSPFRATEGDDISSASDAQLSEVSETQNAQHSPETAEVGNVLGGPGTTDTVKEAVTRVSPEMAESSSLNHQVRSVLVGPEFVDSVASSILSPLDNHEVKNASAQDTSLISSKEGYDVTKDPVTWSSFQVSHWLKSIGFDEEVCSNFGYHRVTGEVLLALNEQDLKEDLGLQVSLSVELVCELQNSDACQNFH